MWSALGNSCIIWGLGGVFRGVVKWGDPGEQCRNSQVCKNIYCVELKGNHSLFLIIVIIFMIPSHPSSPDLSHHSKTRLSFELSWKPSLIIFITVLFHFLFCWGKICTIFHVSGKFSAFGSFAVLCNQCLYLDLELSHHPKMRPCIH